ncbi:hypothetical protein H2200_009637 [Cladophialophora chaetospira]|uniref:Heterokaryon incompatibility domain-containing protein n=1 Tax=Cladophialophora chaetospira TaxID=386627 RepID=A0AA38X314_9EURO|nr:hypothetical protein H2200_009637 [Cladophialophora chaetospira]
MEDVKAASTLESEGEARIVHDPRQRNAHVDDNGHPIEGCLYQSHDIPKPAVSLSGAESSDRIDASEVPISVYTPLKDWQTRILCVEPGAPGQPLVTKLLPVDLIYFEGVVITETQTKIFYEALSYSWGYPHLSRWTECNGQDFPVSDTVFKVLQQQRHLDQAIVINQLDPIEKSAQVQHVFTIFKKATQVIIWLDEGQDTLALRYLETQDSLCHPQTPTTCVDCMAEVRNGLLSLCQRSYFSRTWIRQEIFAARRLIVQVGKFCLTWNLISTLPTYLNRLSQLHVSSDNPVPCRSPPPEFPWSSLLRQGSLNALALLETGDLRRSDVRGQKLEDSIDLDLRKVLLTSSSFRASDPRDFIYGVVGMTNANTRRGGDLDLHHTPKTIALPIDYTRSVSQVFQDATRYLINRDRRLDVILLAFSSRDRGSDLPSWTPDWENLDYNMQQNSNHKDWRQNFFRHYEHACLEGQLPTQKYKDDGILHISGLFYGRLLPNEGDQGLRVVPHATHASLSTFDFLRDTDSCEYDFTSFRRIPTSFYKGYRDSPQPSILAELLDTNRARILIPETSIAGDVVVLAYGLKFPIVLRRVRQLQYQFVGPILTDYFDDALEFGELYYSSEDAKQRTRAHDYNGYLRSWSSGFEAIQLV